MLPSGKSDGSVTLSAEQVQKLLFHLSNMRHDMTGRLANITAAAELIRVRPERTEERLAILLQQPQQAGETIAKFSRELELALGVAR